MKKLFSLILILCVCLFTTALAENMQELQTTVSFQGVGVEVPNSAIGFMVPADLIKQDITPEQAAQGMLLNAGSPDMSYSLEVTLTQTDYDALVLALQSVEGVSGITDYMVNGVNYLSYGIPATNTQVGVVFLGENCDQALSFSFVISEGLNAGQIPLEIMGSLYEL